MFGLSFFGSVLLRIIVIAAGGAPVTEYTYEPFGATVATNPALANPFQFTGRENDGLAGLYYYRARYYNPTLDRFLSEDPLRLEAGDVNFYAYVPKQSAYYNFTDPNGTVISTDALPAEWVASRFVWKREMAHSSGW